MAVPYSQIVTDTLQTFHKTLIDVIFTENFLLSRWAKKASGSAGRSILEPALYAKLDNAGTFDPYSTFNTDNNQKRTMYEFQWKYYQASIKLFEVDKFINQGAGVFQIVNMIKNEFEVARKSLDDEIAADLFQVATTDPLGLVGLGSAISSTPTLGTYGGISRVTNTWWRNQQAAMAVLNLDDMFDMYMDCTDNQDSPTIAVGTKDIMRIYNSHLTPIQRINDATAGRAGFQKLFFLDMPILQDNNCPTQTLYYINEKYINWYYLKGVNFMMRDPIVPENQWVSTKTIFYGGMFFINNPQRCGVHTAVAA